LFYLSKVTPLFFLLALTNLLIGFFLKISSQDYIHYGFVFVFGFIAITIIGAMYQIIPNSQQRQLYLPNLSYISFLLGVILSILLVFQSYKLASIVFFVLVVLFSAHVLPVLKNVKPITIKFLTASLVYMFLSSIVFLLTNFFQIPLQAVIHTFTVGAMINAVFGVEFAWIPMFYMQTVNTKRGNFIFWLNQLSVIFILISFLTLNYKLISFAVLLQILVTVLFLWFVIDTVKRGKALTGIPYAVKFFSAGLSFLLGGLVVAFFVSFTKNHILIDFHIDFMILGFGVFTITGGMLHLTPRILWNIVYVKKAQQGKQVPQVNMVIPKNKAERFFSLLFLSFIIGLLTEGFGFTYGWALFYFVFIFYSIYFVYKLAVFTKI